MSFQIQTHSISRDRRALNSRALLDTILGFTLFALIAGTLWEFDRTTTEFLYLGLLMGGLLALRYIPNILIALGVLGLIIRYFVISAPQIVERLLPVFGFGEPPSSFGMETIYALENMDFFYMFAIIFCSLYLVYLGFKLVIDLLHSPWDNGPSGAFVASILNVPPVALSQRTFRSVRLSILVVCSLYFALAAYVLLIYLILEPALLVQTVLQSASIQVQPVLVDGLYLDGTTPPPQRPSPLVATLTTVGFEFVRLLVTGLLVTFLITGFLRKTLIYSIRFSKDKTKSRDSILFLRPFTDDFGTVEKRWQNLLSWLLNFGKNFSSIDEILSYELVRHGRTVAIANPEAKQKKLAYERLLLAHSDWQEEALRLMEDARLIVLVYGTTEGVKWEVDTALGRSELREKLLILIPNNDAFEHFQRNVIKNDTKILFPQNKRDEIPICASFPDADNLVLTLTDRRDTAAFRIVLSDKIYGRSTASAR